MIIGASGFDMPNGVLTYTDDISNVQKPNYQYNQDNTIIDCLGTLDGYFPYSAMSEYTDSYGNKFIKIPKFWVNISEGSLKYVKFSDVDQGREWFIPRCFLNKSQTKYADYVYLSVYEGSYERFENGLQALVSKITYQAPIEDNHSDLILNSTVPYGNEENYYNGYSIETFDLHFYFSLLVAIYMGKNNYSWDFRGVNAKFSSPHIIEPINSHYKCTQHNGLLKTLGIYNLYGNLIKLTVGRLIRIQDGRIKIKDYNTLTNEVINEYSDYANNKNGYTIDITRYQMPTMFSGDYYSKFYSAYGDLDQALYNDSYLAFGGSYRGYNNGAFSYYSFDRKNYTTDCNARLMLRGDADYESSYVLKGDTLDISVDDNFSEVVVFRNGVEFGRFTNLDTPIRLGEVGEYYYKIIPSVGFNEYISPLISYKGGISINLYQNSSENNRVVKDINQVGILYGVIKQSTSITNPIIIIESENLPTFNYVYIGKFNRYYYVNDIVSIRNNLWEIDMSVDVLMSYKDTILNQSVIVGRNEFEWNDMLIDNGVKTEYQYGMENIDVLGFAVVKDYEHTDYTYNIENFNEYFRFSMSVVNTKDLISSNEYGSNNAFNSVYILTYEDYGFVTTNILRPEYLDSLLSLFEDKSQCIRSNKIIPFKFDNLIGCNAIVTDNIDGMYIGTGTIGINREEGVDKSFKIEPGSGFPIALTFCQGYKNYHNEIDYIPIHINPKFNNFLDFNPYTILELYLPYLGYVEINPQLVMNKDFYITYLIDTTNYDFTAVLTYELPNVLVYDGDRNFKNFNSHDIIYSWDGNISIDMPIGGSNRNEIYKAITNTALSISTKGIIQGISSKTSNENVLDVRKSKKRGSALRSRIMERELKEENVSTAINILSDTLSQLLNSTPSMHFSECVGNGTERLYSGKMHIRRRYVNPIYPNNYNHLIGRPLNDSRMLFNVHGFTTIIDVHLEGFTTATNEELNSIENILLNGVILP